MYLWHETKDDVAAGWRFENSSEVYNGAAGNLSKAFKAFFKHTGKFPKFKKKQWDGSAKFSKKAVTIVDRHHVSLSRIGTLKTFESMRKMCRHLERGSGELVSATLKRETGGWFVVFTCKIQVPEVTPRTGDKTVGLDLGLTTLIVGATPEGELVLTEDNPRYYASSQKQLARAQKVASRRQGPQRRKTDKDGNIVQEYSPGSKRYLKAQARVRKHHARIRNLRTNNLHRISSQLVKDYDIIVVETLNVKGMLQNPNLAKHISDASWGTFVSMLTYKCERAGATLVKAPRFYPSSKTCSNCGSVKAKLTLEERVFVCENCDYRVDRDLNAAVNLARLGITSPTGTNPEAERGGDGKTKTGILAEAHPVESLTLHNA
jgi:putative transposase